MIVIYFGKIVYNYVKMFTRKEGSSVRVLIQKAIDFRVNTKLSNARLYKLSNDSLFHPVLKIFPCLLKYRYYFCCPNNQEKKLSQFNYGFPCCENFTFIHLHCTLSILGIFLYIKTINLKTYKYIYSFTLMYKSLYVHHIFAVI